VSFKDHFSGHSSQYAEFRPRYPLELFSFLQSIAPGNRLAWDCATGNGQAAVNAARFFDRVIATDASKGQLAEAVPDPRVEYRHCPAESCGLEDATVDLVTVAQALHWLPLDAFFNEAARALKPGGILAVWCYNLLNVSPGMDPVLARFYHDIVGPFWPGERTLVENGYRGISLPFDEVEAPPFAMTAEWSLSHLLGYVGTWSATQRYMKATGENPLDELSEEIVPMWGDPQAIRHIQWPLSVRVCKKPETN
jgi:ubiquinone/menaquinone biosynthesis C-methylase UbiE